MEGFDEFGVVEVELVSLFAIGNGKIGSVHVYEAVCIPAAKTPAVDLAAAGGVFGEFECEFPHFGPGPFAAFMEGLGLLGFRNALLIHEGLVVNPYPGVVRGAI